MPIPVALCAVCGQRVCDHDDFQFAGFTPADRSASHGAATLPAAASLNPPMVAGAFSNHRVHADPSTKGMS